MQTFIVLGIIPGTNIQTTLNFWIVVSLLLTVVLSRRSLATARDAAYRTVRVYKIAYMIRRSEPHIAYVP